LKDKIAPALKPIQLQFRAAKALLLRSIWPLPLDPNSQTKTPPVTPRASPPRTSESVVTPTRPVKSVSSKSYAQVETSVLRQGVTQKSCGLKPRKKERAPLTVRYSEDQIKLLDAKAKEAGVTRSEYIRRLSLGGDYIPTNDRELTRILFVINRELTRQGNNLNQIARQLNGRIITQAQGESMLDVLGTSMLETHKAVRKTLARGETEPAP